MSLFSSPSKTDEVVLSKNASDQAVFIPAKGVKSFACETDALRNYEPRKLTSGEITEEWTPIEKPMFFSVKKSGFEVCVAHRKKAQVAKRFYAVKLFDTLANRKLALSSHHTEESPLYEIMVGLPGIDVLPMIVYKTLPREIDEDGMPADPTQDLAVIMANAEKKKREPRKKDMIQFLIAGKKKGENKLEVSVEDIDSIRSKDPMRYTDREKQIYLAVRAFQDQDPTEFDKYFGIDAQ